MNIIGGSANLTATLQLQWDTYSLDTGLYASSGSITLNIAPVRVSAGSYSYRIDLSNLFSADSGKVHFFTNSLITIGGSTPYQLFDSSSCFVLSGGVSKTENVDSMTFDTSTIVALGNISRIVYSDQQKFFFIHSASSGCYVKARIAAQAPEQQGIVLLTKGIIKLSYLKPGLFLSYGSGDVYCEYVYTNSSTSVTRLIGTCYQTPLPASDNTVYMDYVNNMGVTQRMYFFTELTDVTEITPSDLYSTVRDDGQSVDSIKRGTVRRKYSLPTGYLDSVRYSMLRDLLTSDSVTFLGNKCQVTCSGIDRNYMGRTPFSTVLAIDVLFDDII